MLIYGKHPILEALKANKSLNKILIQNELKSELLPAIKEFAAQKEIPVQFVPLAKLDRLVKENHQGIVGLISMIEYYKVEDILDQVYQKGQFPLFLILDEITDVRNFGAIARTALNAGVHAIIVPFKGSANINPEAMKASAGALNKIPVCREQNLKQTIKNLKLNGVQIVATATNTNKLIFNIDLTVPTAIILGSEDVGINPLHLREADEIVKVPMSGELDSYNVSVTAGIVLYEVLRQQLAK